MMAGPQPDIAGILDAWDSGGFDGMAAKAAELSGVKDRAAMKFALASTFHRCFSTPEGRDVLETLLNWTLRRSSWYVPGAALESARTLFAPSQADIMAYGLQREGQNMIVALILDLLAEAERGPPAAIEGASS